MFKSLYQLVVRVELWLDEEKTPRPNKNHPPEQASFSLHGDVLSEEQIATVREGAALEALGR